MSVVWFAKVSEKGLVVIPKELREKYGIKKGDKVSFVDYGGAVYFMRVPDDPISSSLGMFKTKSGPSMTELLLQERRESREKEERELGRWDETGNAPSR
jgi:AbrB family looped-hinge helix DNA binding protein